MAKNQNEKVEEAQESPVTEEAIIEEVVEETKEDVVLEEPVEEVIEKPVIKSKDKREIRGYTVINPNQPKGVYQQTITFHDVKFNFKGATEDSKGGCLINSRLKHIADAFKKEKGFIVEPFYGINKYVEED